MAPRSNFMTDLAQMANGAASAFGGMREEVDNLIRQRMERSLNARGLVTREEFDALGTRHEALAARLALLESMNPPATESQAKTKVKAKPVVLSSKRQLLRRRCSSPQTAPALRSRNRLSLARPLVFSAACNKTSFASLSPSPIPLPRRPTRPRHRT